jgi:hypothetical protein
VYEMMKDGNFGQLFGFLSSDLRQLCLTQAQILIFVKRYGYWLKKSKRTQRKDMATFFLFESKDNFFVAAVGVCPSGIHRVRVYRVNAPDVWYAENRRRVVVPQLTCGSCSKEGD